MATRTRTLLMVGAALALAPAAPAAQTTEAGDTLSLAEVYAMADARNPMLSATRARVDAVRSMESASRLPPDPQLRLGVMNASLPGLRADMPASMAPSIEVMQMVPLPGKLGLAGSIARAETGIVGAEAAEAAWMVRVRAAMAFHDIYAADREIETMTRTLRLLEDFEDVARSAYASGSAPQADVLRAGVEVARMRADVRRMAAMREVAVARLNGILDRPVETPVVAVALPPAPDRIPAPGVLREWADGTRPLLHRAELAVQQAETRSVLARRELWPDLSVGLQYGQREDPEMGRQRMGSLMVGASVPVFAARRQLKMREEAAAMLRMADAERDDARAAVHAGIAELLAGLDRVRTLSGLYASEVVPQARAAVESAFSSYRLGAVDFMALIDAQMTLNEYERELYRLEAEHGQLVAELEMTVGREIPTIQTTELEDR